jgi:hypothetical protein
MKDESEALQEPRNLITAFKISIDDYRTVNREFVTWRKGPSSL